MRSKGTGGLAYALLAALLAITLLFSPVMALNTVTVSGVISSVTAPVAAFSGAPTSGSAPLTVVFTDASTGSITSRAWDFDNNGVVDSTAQNPTYTYTAAGTYAVNLTVTGPGGSDSEVKTGYITVTILQPPVAAFTGAPTSGYVPLTVAFTDQSTNSPTSWKWEYQKSGARTWTQFSTAQNPSYTFTATGTYSIRLKATNTAGSNTLTKTNYITVSTPPKPVAAFTASPTSGRPPLAVQFTDQSTNSPTSWKWEYQKSGARTWTQFSTAQNPSYTFTTIGQYSIRLTATNAGGSSTLTKNNYIQVGQCGIVVAYFTGLPISGPRPLTVQFTDGSTGPIDTWEWDFQNDGTYDSTLKNPSFTYTEKKKYSVKLTVTNACSMSTMIRYNYINAL